MRPSELRRVQTLQRVDFACDPQLEERCGVSGKGLRVSDLRLQGPPCAFGEGLWTKRKPRSLNDTWDEHAKPLILSSETSAPSAWLGVAV